LSIIQSFDWSQEEKDSQHDIHEFSRYFLELIQTQISPQGLSVDFFNKFIGKFVSSIYSTHHSPIVTDNNFGDLSLSIKNSTHLEECLNKFTSATQIQGEYFFDDNTTEPATMTTTFVILPEILHIQLNRFDFFSTNGPQKKLEYLIKCPQQIDLKKYLISNYQNPETIYILSGILVHRGTAFSGHYFAELKIGISSNIQNWICFNYSSVYSISKPTIERPYSNHHFQETPYILINIRKDCIQSLFQI
jgi:ubiquitin C-terminal hydrolase